MKTYYTIFFYQSPFGDRINLAVLMFDGKGFKYKYSYQRIESVRPMQPNAMYLLLTAIKGMTLSYSDKNLPTVNSIRKMHKQMHNIIGVDNPKLVDIEFTKENFNRLAEKILF